MKSYILITLGALLLSIGNAQAHSIWTEPTDKPNQYAIKFGHETPEPYPEHKLKSIELIDSAGNVTPVQHSYANQEAYFDAGDSSIAMITFDNGIWAKAPDGDYVEKSPRQDPSLTDAVNPVKLAKVIFRWDEQATKPHAVEYELVPQGEPIIGEPMNLLVLHNEQPVSGAQVGLGEDMPYQTSDAQGLVSYTPSAGSNRVWTKFEQAISDNPDYAQRSYEYILAFEGQSEKNEFSLAVKIIAWSVFAVVVAILAWRARQRERRSVA